MIARASRLATEHPDAGTADAKDLTRRRATEHDAAPSVDSLFALRSPGHSPRASAVRALQLRIGNRATARLLGADTGGREHAPGTVSLPARGSAMQRWTTVRRNGEEKEAEEADEAPADANFTPAQILFASISGGVVGSIYFPNGRIRLVHGGGPEIGLHPGIVRYTISEEDYRAHWKTRGTRAFIESLPSCQPAASGAPGRLVEFWPGHRHVSRGGPQPFTWALTQRQLNIIYNAALSRDNGVLLAAMAADPLLSTIPTA